MSANPWQIGYSGKRKTIAKLSKGKTDLILKKVNSACPLLTCLNKTNIALIHMCFLYMKKWEITKKNAPELQFKRQSTWRYRLICTLYWATQKIVFYWSHFYQYASGPAIPNSSQPNSDTVLRLNEIGLTLHIQWHIEFCLSFNCTYVHFRSSF